VLSAIDKGFFQSEIADASFRYQREIERNDRVIVGVNSYCDANNEKGGGELLKIDEKVEREQVAALTELKKKRDAGKVKASLERLKTDAKSGANVMYALIDCVEAYASLGEMCDIFREVYGVYEEPPMF